MYTMCASFYFIFIFFFKQKTAYEMRISDWSSDVCSSDLVARRFPPALAALVGYAQHRPNLGNVEGQCPSILLRDDVPEHLAAIDALRPDQAEIAEMFVRSQMDELG